MIAPPEAGLGRRRGWALPHFGTKAEERQSIERKSGGNRGPVIRVKRRKRRQRFSAIGR